MGACLTVASVSVNAAMISFDDDATIQDGTVRYNGIGGALIGEDIDFRPVLGVDTPANAGVAVECIDCVLNFTTGSNTSEGPALWTFAGGGSLTISGTLSDGAGGFADYTGVIVTGSFDSAAVIADGNNNGTLIVNGIGTDEKAEWLIRKYEIWQLGGVSWDFAQTEISLGNVEYLTSQSCIRCGDGGFLAGLTNADFDNLATVVPVPAAAWLFGSGLLGLVGIARRKKA